MDPCQTSACILRFIASSPLFFFWKKTYIYSSKSLLFDVCHSPSHVVLWLGVGSESDSFCRQRCGLSMWWPFLNSYSMCDLIEFDVNWNSCHRLIIMPFMNRCESCKCVCQLICSMNRSEKVSSRETVEIRIRAFAPEKKSWLCFKPLRLPDDMNQMRRDMSLRWYGVAFIVRLFILLCCRSVGSFRIDTICPPWVRFQFIRYVHFIQIRKFIQCLLNRFHFAIWAYTMRACATCGLCVCARTSKYDYGMVDWQRAKRMVCKTMK